MNEDTYRNFRQKYYLDELKNIIIAYQKLKKDERNKILLEENREKFSKFLNFINKNIEDKDFQLINDYEICVNNIKENKKFVLLSSQNIKIFAQNNSIYFFIRDKEPYIFFQREKKLLKVIIDNEKSEFCNLKEYIFEEKWKIIEYLNTIKKIMNNFNNNKFDVPKELINEYYLINNKWIDYAEKRIRNKDIYINESFKPKFNISAFIFECPQDFFIVKKDEKNKLMMNYLIEYFDIKQEDIFISKVSILKEKYNYICVMIDSIAYFYKGEDKKETQKEKIVIELSYAIKFNNEKIMEQELTNRISSFGIEFYINHMFLSNKGTIYDLNFDKIGELININENEIFIKGMKQEEKKKTKNIKLNSLLICLSNIKELRDFIPKKIVKNDKDDEGNIIDITFHLNFFAILRIVKKKNPELLIGNNFENKLIENYAVIYKIFITQIKDLSTKENKNEKIDIFENINLLIKTIILELQDKLYQSENNKSFIYDYTKTLQFKPNKIDKKTIIEKLFCFEIEINKKCKCKENNILYQRKYYLEFDLNEEDKKSMDILLLLQKLYEKEKCPECNEISNIEKKLISLPEYLIIVVNDTNKIKKTILQNNIDIKNFCHISDKSYDNKFKYELIIFTNESFETLIKSNIDNKWRINNEKAEELNIERKLPNLLIYKRIKQNK